MDDDIVAGGTSSNHGDSNALSYVPMRVGDAMVWIQPTGRASESASEIHTAAPSPDKVFKESIAAIKECIRSIGDGLDKLQPALRPQELSVEFSLTFDAKGRASIVPILVTAETGVQTGLKVTAKWTPGVPDTPELPNR